MLLPEYSSTPNNKKSMVRVKKSDKDMFFSDILSIDKK